MAEFDVLAPQVISRLTADLGLTPAQAAGIVGQLGYESEGLKAINERKPVVPGSRGGFGWAQWTGPRRKEFESFVDLNGMDVSSPEANYQFLLHELTNTPESKVLDAIRSTENAKDAGRVFTNEFLRPGVKAQDKRDSWVDRVVSLAIPSAQASTFDDKLNSDPLFQMLSSSGSGATGSEPVNEKLAQDPLFQLLSNPGKPTPEFKAEEAAEEDAKRSGVLGAIESLGAGARKFGQGLGQGLGDLPAGVGQSAVHQGQATLGAIDELLGTSLATRAAGNVAARDAEIAQREAEYQTATPGSALAGAGRVAGSLAPAFIGGPAAAASPFITGANIGARALPSSQGLGRLLGAGVTSAGMGGGFSANAPIITNPEVSNDYGAQVDRNALLGMGIGGALPAAGAGVNALGRYAGGGLRSLIEPFTGSGQQAIAERTLGRAAQGAPIGANAEQIVPGSIPTLAEATGNPGISTLQRSIRDLNPNEFVAREQANSAARLAQLGSASGESGDVIAAKAARDLSAGAKLPQIFGNATKADAQPVVATIDSILSGPSGKRDAVSNSLNNIRGKLIDSKGAIEDNPEILYNSIRKQIGDMLDSRMATSNPAGLQASRELLQVRDVLDGAIEKAAPGFDQYLNAYQTASKPIDAMGYLQGLSLTDAQGNITLQKVQTAIRGIEKQAAKPGANPAKSIMPDQITALKAIRDDLLRGQSAGLGRSAGSSTAQNLATQNMLSQAIPGKLGALAGKMPSGTIGAGLGAGTGFMVGGPIGAAAGAAIGNTVGRAATGAMNFQNEAIQSVLQKMLLNEGGSGLAALQRATSAPRPLTNMGGIQRLLYPAIAASGGRGGQ